ncbi:hypothetical protein CPLU01_11563 [Colletotrichum plurivorum]|uniref:Peptidase S8/S53 domain-containing protein n=1 Tax=Colletotrichum plurivorum TaxID=2175906 RepID=A0A8H6N817_9PEZI|nr:hypothetical protein CPLU01_11563 [Colletotrichum plurivorum]
METLVLRGQEKHSSVAGYVRSCLFSLELCPQKAAKVHPRELSMMEDQFSRFCVWKDSIGVFSEGRSSLDHRLREAPEVREIIIALSETFNYRLQESTVFMIRNEYGDDVEPFLADQFEHYIRDRFPNIGENIASLLPEPWLSDGNKYFIADLAMERNHKGSLGYKESPSCRNLSPKLPFCLPCSIPKRKRVKNQPKATTPNLARTRLEVFYNQQCRLLRPSSPQPSKEPQAAHSGKFSDSQLEMIADRNSLIMDPIFESCPLCGTEDIGANMEGHIAGHLQLLALKSLPAYEQEALEVGELQDEETGSLALSGQHSRTMVAVREDHKAISPSVNSVGQYPEDHSCDFIEESLFNNTPLTDRRAYEWGFAIQHQLASKDAGDDPILRDFWSVFVPDLEYPADWTEILGPQAEYDPEYDGVIQSFAAHARGDPPLVPRPTLGEMYTRCPSSYVWTGRDFDSVISSESALKATSTDDPPLKSMGSSVSDMYEPRFAPSARPEDTWIREQFEEVQEMLKRMDESEPVKIAVLDTGCNLNASQFLKFPQDRQRIIWRDFAGSSRTSIDEDETDGGMGHGTLVVSFLLNLLPLATIVVCRIAKERPRIDPKSDQITAAIIWAVRRRDVDVVCLAFGVSPPTNVLVLANSRRAQGLTFRQYPPLIFVACTEGAHLPDFADYVIPVWAAEADGTSTAILAATTALFLQYTSSFAIWKSKVGSSEYTGMGGLRWRLNMEALFRKIGTETDEHMWFVKPSSLFFDVTRWPQSYSEIVTEVLEDSLLFERSPFAV